MDLTIVIPVYRGETTVARTLDSIERAWKAMGCPAGLEVVIVVDGDVDGSSGICHDWRSRVDLPVTVIVQENSGIAAARNAGWLRARTTWITFLDADDEITPARLRLAGGALRGGSVYVGCQDVHVQPGLRIPSLPGVDLGQHDQARFALLSMLLERRTIESLGGFREGFTMGDDWDFMVRLREHGVRFEYVEEIFLIRHIHGANVSLDERALVSEYLGVIRAHARRRAERGPDPSDS